MSPPLPESRLTQIAKEACDTTLSSSTTYTHASTAAWNDTIINKILQSLLTATSTATEAPTFKFVVNSTIIQHARPTQTGEESPSAAAGRTGMHSAAGAYWNNEKDGMWSYKYGGGEGKGMDIVICVMWVGL